MIELPFIAASSLPIWIVLGYLVMLLALGVYSGTLFRGTSKDYFVASRSIGSFMLLMSVFGTTMTGFALVGSTGKAFTTGVATYGALASWSGIIHSAVFFVIGLRLWAIGKRHGYVTQVEFFRARFDSHHLGTVLFVLLVLLIIPYLLIGIISAGKFVQVTTKGMFEAGWLAGGVPPWLTGLIICSVVLSYVFLGGVRSAVWANTFQTIIFMLTGVVAFLMISKAVANKTEAGSGSILENVKRAAEFVEQKKPARLTMGIHPLDRERYDEQQEAYDTYSTKQETWDELVKEMGEEQAKEMAEHPGDPVTKPTEPKRSMPHMFFITFLFIPLSVGMFPHVFQHWLTARSAKSFRLAIVAHPVCIAIVWLPCILIGVWAAGLFEAQLLQLPLKPDGSVNSSAVLGAMVGQLVESPWLLGLLMAGVLAAIMSSLDSQFACLGTMFTNDIVIATKGKDFYSDEDKVKLARIFVVGVVVVAYLVSLLLMKTASVFNLGMWCFSGFTALFPIVVAALYWKRATAVGAFACIVVTAVLWTYWFNQSGYGANKAFAVYGMLPVAPLTLVSSAALVIGSLCSKSPESRLVNRFFPRTQNGA